jgi:hypothetical protein
MPAVAALFLKAPILKKSSGRNKYALLNKDTEVNVAGNFRSVKGFAEKNSRRVHKTGKSG